MTRRAVGIQIADAADPDKELGYFHADPEALAEMAAEYCSDLEQTDSSTAQANLEDELASYVQFNGGPGNKDPRIAAVSARLVLSWVEEAATEIVCPDLGSSKFLPEN